MLHFVLNIVSDLILGQEDIRTLYRLTCGSPRASLYDIHCFSITPSAFSISSFAYANLYSVTHWAWSARPRVTTPKMACDDPRSYSSHSSSSFGSSGIRDPVKKWGKWNEPINPGPFNHRLIKIKHYNQIYTRVQI